MAGSEELARFLPRSREASDYLQDPGLLSANLNEMSRMQAERLRNMGAIRASGAGNIGNGLALLGQKYREGQKMASEEATAAEQRANMQSQRGAQDIQNKRAGLGLKSEEDLANYMNEDVGGGMSRAKQLRESQFAEELAAPKYAQQKRELEGKLGEQNIASSKAQIEMAKAQLAALGLQAKTAAEDRAQTQFANAVNAVLVSDIPDAQKQTQIDTLTAQAKASKTGMTPQAIDAISTGLRGQNKANLAQAAFQKETSTALTPQYGSMKSAADSATAQANTIRQLQNHLQTYKQHLRFGKAGEVLGSAGGESAPAAAAREAFERDVATIDPTLARDIGTTGLTGVPERMQTAIDILSQRVRTGLESAKKTVTPDMQKRPEFAGAQELVQGLPLQGGVPRNQLQFGPPGQTAVVNNQQFTNPQQPGPGTATAAPMPAPTPFAPAPQGANPAMVPPGQIVPPDFFKQFMVNPPQPAKGAPLK